MSPFKPVESRAEQIANTTAKKSNKSFFDIEKDDLNDRIEFDQSIKVGHSSNNRVSQQNRGAMHTPQKT